jgi:hypothetical protein
MNTEEIMRLRILLLIGSIGLSATLAFSKSSHALNPPPSIRYSTFVEGVSDDTSLPLKIIVLKEIEPSWQVSKFIVENGIDFFNISNFIPNHMNAAYHLAISPIALHDYKTP